MFPIVTILLHYFDLVMKNLDNFFQQLFRIDDNLVAWKQFLEIIWMFVFFLGNREVTILNLISATTERVMKNLED